MKILILGFGNLDRQDDGVAWHVLSRLMEINGLPKPESIDINDYSPNKEIHFLFQLQLVPEIADDLEKYDYAIFIDAHTGAVPLELNIIEVEPEYQNSPLTHHLTAPSLLSITRKIHTRYPKSILVSIRGYEFEFSQKLSSRTNNLVESAVAKINEWVNNLYI